MRRLIRDLDSDDYAVRRRAADELHRLAERPEIGRLLTEDVQSVLVSANVSLEVRQTLESVQSFLPKAERKAAQHVSTGDLDQLVRKLEDDAYAVRIGASKRLAWLLESPAMACPIFLRLKARMASGSLAADGRRWLEPIYRKARRTGSRAIRQRGTCRRPPIARSTNGATRAPGTLGLGSPRRRRGDAAACGP